MKIMPGSQKFLFLIIIAVLVFLGGVLVKDLSLVKTDKEQEFPPSSPTQQNTEEKIATFLLSPQKAAITQGNKLSLAVKFKAEGLSLSAITVRLTSSFDQDPSLQPQDADSQKEGIQAEINSELTQQNWFYPVNKIEIDQENKLIVVEIAAVNLSPDGFLPQSEETLATIDFLIQSSTEEIAFNFDPTQTQLTTKENQEVKLSLENGSYSPYD